MDIKTTSSNQTTDAGFPDFLQRLSEHTQSEADAFLKYLDKNVKSPLENLFDEFLNGPLPSLFDKPNPKPPSFELNPEMINLKYNPESLIAGPKAINEQSLRITPPQEGLPHGQLDDDSKTLVNEFIWDISKDLDREIHASVAHDDKGPLVTFTAGNRSGVNYSIPENTVYSAHTHLSGIMKATPTDLRNNVPNVEDALVVNGEGLVYA